MITSKKKVKNKVGEHCQIIVDDFFNFCDGKADKVTTIDIRDIKDPMPPEIDQIRIMLARCKQAWSYYCKLAGLLRECIMLLTNRVKEIWQIKEKEQKMQERKRVK